MLGPNGKPRSGVLSWILRGALAVSLLGTLWIVAPAPAFARPQNITPGPLPTGDPTADEQPSPTPKPKARSVQIPTYQGTNHDATLGRGTVTVRIPWAVYLRLLARNWVR